jgi:hypothetical protein
MIIAAAIRARDGAIWTLPPPARHHDIGRFMLECGEPTPYPSGDDRGFIVSATDPFTGRVRPLYQRRVPAKRIAEKAGQILFGKGQHRELLSEDMW